MGGRWALAGRWLCRGLNKTLPPAATPCFFRSSLTHAPTPVAAGAIFRRPVDRTAVATTTQRHMHYLAPRADFLANHLRASRLMNQSSFFSSRVDRTFTGSIRAKTVAGPLSPLPTLQMQQTGKSMSTKTPGSDSDNVPRFRGVSWCKQKSKWVSRIGVISFHIGFFDCQITAARHIDIAIRYLVQSKVLDEAYLARTNVSLGLLEPFDPTAEETERVAKRWEEKLGREFTSLFRGVARSNSVGEYRKVWGARFTDESGQSHWIGSFSTEIEAACAVDEAVRACKVPKSKKLRRINFFRENDYLTENQASRVGCIGVSRCQRSKNLSKPWRIHGLHVAIARTSSAMETPGISPCDHKIRVGGRRYLGCSATKLEAIEVYDRFVLDEWAQQDEPRGPLPPTNFSPAKYGYELISPPTIPPLKESEAENPPKRAGRPRKNTLSPLPGN